MSAKGLRIAVKSSGAQNSFIHKVQKIVGEDFASKANISSYDGEALKGSSGTRKECYGQILWAWNGHLSNPPCGRSRDGAPRVADRTGMEAILLIEKLQPHVVGDGDQ